MATELNEQSTTEEVHEYVEQVVQEVQAERAGEQKSDSPKGHAQIVSEHADNEKKTRVTVEEDHASGRLDVIGKLPKGKAASQEDEGENKTGQSWLDDGLKAEVSAYGIEESELADFASREELERALRFLDRRAQEAGRQAMAQEADEPESQGRNEKGQFTKKVEAEAEPVRPAVSSQGYQPLDRNVYDDGIVDHFTAFNDRIAALEAQLYEAHAAVEEQHFDSLVDSLGHADLFGKTGKEDARQLQRRQDLHVAVKAQQIGLSQLGRPAELDEALVNRVARMVFADDLGKKDLKNRTRKISRQSNGRQGGGATRATDAREDPREEFDRLYKELEGNT